MAVKPFPKDSDGTGLDTKVTNLTASVNALPAGSAKVSASAALVQAQIELVVHYMEHGRINPATVLSTLS